jgi:CPA2 family monovalent cation:H+ antiporter-2
MPLAPLIKDLAIILAAAAAVTFVFQRLGLPLILGYILAGIAIAQSAPVLPAISDLPNVRVWGELGIVFLMFTLGLDFSFRRLAAVGLRAIFTGIFEITGLIAIGFGLGRLWGWGTIGSLFLGGTVAISSTTILLKSLEELGLRRLRFADTVFGILIIEDLVAVGILVALSTMITQGQIEGLSLVMLAVRLFLVVGTWLLIGFFIVPRILLIAARSGSDELLTILALGLCLILVVFASHFGFSPALGAFIMGSIIGETPESKKIDDLIKPLRDVFVAIFFVSIGMLADPLSALEHWPTLLGVTALILIGKPVFLFTGSLLAGHELRASTQIGLSMAQIGEFSFLIAGLGGSLNATPDHFSAIIIGASLLTTLTTPALMRSSARIGEWLEARLPIEWVHALHRYTTLFQIRSPEGRSSDNGPVLASLVRWFANGILVTALFALASEQLRPWLSGRLNAPTVAEIITATLALLAALPFLWAMLTCFRDISAKTDLTRGTEFLLLLFSRVLALLWLGIVSARFLSAWTTFIAALVLITVIAAAFYRRLETSYEWLEKQFLTAFTLKDSERRKASAMERLAPWDAHLVQLKVHPDSELIGMTLNEAKLRERFGLNIVAIERGSRLIAAPSRDERVFPHDELLVLSTDEQLEEARGLIEGYATTPLLSYDLSDFDLKMITVTEDSFLRHTSIFDSRLREKYGVLVVGIERGGRRMINPPSQLILEPGDRLWLVGDRSRLREIS